MITKEFVLKFFQAFYIQRWNDKLRPIDFIEIDKHAHKFFIAYILGRFEETEGKISWHALIEGSLFECLQKIVLTDIKSPVLYAIRKRPTQYRTLMKFVIADLAPILESMDHSFLERFIAYMTDETQSKEKSILCAASIIASEWEFDIIERANPHGFEMPEIRSALSEQLHKERNLRGVREIKKNRGLQAFIDLCGQLRFQSRWAHVHRIPKTSVIGHCYFVAMISYLYSLFAQAGEKRLYNNTFAGLFHDLPEVLTRDIVAPIKRSSEGLQDLILEYEKEQMEKNVYPLLPSFLHEEIRLFTQLGEKNVIQEQGKQKQVTLAEVQQKYNEDSFNACEGEIVKAADELSAYIESSEALQNGCVSEKFHEARTMITEKYKEKGVQAGIDFAAIYQDI